LIVEKKHTDNFTILYVEGLIKLGESAEFFSAALENVLKNESTNVIITHQDRLHRFHRNREMVGYLGKFSNQNRKLILVNPSERIMKLLKLAKLDAVFKIYGSEEEAIGAESGPLVHPMKFIRASARITGATARLLLTCAISAVVPVQSHAIERCKRPGYCTYTRRGLSALQCFRG